MARLDFKTLAYRLLVAFGLGASVLCGQMLWFSDPQSDSYAVDDRSVGIAEYYYWVGLADGGNSVLFDKGLELISKLVGETPFDPELLALKSDLLEQRDMGHDTLGGVFPLARFAASPEIDLSTPFGLYETIDDADVVAATQATSSMLEQIVNNYRSNSGFDVLFVMPPEIDDALANEALYLFNQSSRFFVHNKIDQHRFIETALNSQQRQDFLKGEVDSEVARLAASFFDTNALIIFQLQSQPAPSDGSFFIAQSKVYLNQGAVLDSTIRNMGFAIDRVGVFPLIAFIFVTTAGFLLAPVFVERDWSLSIRAACVVVFGLSVSWIFAPAILLTLVQFLPVFTLETLAISSFPIAILIAVAWGCGLVTILYRTLDRVAVNLQFVMTRALNKLFLQSLFHGSSLWLLTLAVTFDPSQNLIISAYVVIKTLIVSTVILDSGSTSKEALNRLIFPVLMLDLALIHLGPATPLILGTVLFFWLIIAGLSGEREDKAEIESREISSSEDALLEENEAFDIRGLEKTHPNESGIFINIVSGADEDYARFILNLFARRQSRVDPSCETHTFECGMAEWDFIESVIDERFEDVNEEATETGLVSDVVASLPFGSLLAVGEASPDLSRENIIKNAVERFCRHVHGQRQLYIVFGKNALTRSSIDFLQKLKERLDKKAKSRVEFFFLTGATNVQTPECLREILSEELTITYPNQKLGEAYLKNFIPNASSAVVGRIIESIRPDGGDWDPRDIRSVARRLAIIATDSDDFESHLESALGAIDFDLVDELNELLLNREYAQLVLSGMLLLRLNGQIEVQFLSESLGKDIFSVLETIDRINDQIPIFADNSFPNLSFRFRSIEIEKAIGQALSIDLPLSQQPAWHQAVRMRVIVTLVVNSRLNASDDSAVFDDLSKVQVSNASELLHPLMSFTARRFILFVKQSQSYGNSYKSEVRSNFLQIFGLLFEKFDAILRINQLDRHEVASNYSEYMLMRACFCFEESQMETFTSPKGEKFASTGLQKQQKNALVAHIDGLQALLDVYPLVRISSTDFVIFLVSDLATKLKALSGDSETDQNVLERLKDRFTAQLQNALEQLKQTHPVWVHVRLSLTLALQQRGNHSLEDQASSIQKCRALLKLVPSWSRDPSELLARGQVLQSIANMDSESEDALDIANEAIEIMTRFSDFEAIPATYGAVARAPFFSACKADDRGEKNPAVDLYREFLNRLPEWMSWSKQYPNSDRRINNQVMLLALTLETRAWGSLYRLGACSNEVIMNQFERLQAQSKFYFDAQINDSNLGSFLYELFYLKTMISLTVSTSDVRQSIDQIERLIQGAIAPVVERWFEVIKPKITEKYLGV